MVNVFGNEIIGAFTNGVAVEAIYANGELVWPTSLYYYVKWDRSYYTGSFTMNGNTYSYESYYPRNRFSSPDFSGIITSSAFMSGPFSYIKTNAVRIDEYAFANCSSLTTVSLPVCEYVGSGVFRRCSSLTSVNLPVCSYINQGAFYGCSSLTQISLPVCEYVGSGTFYLCSSLTTVSLPKCEYIDYIAFAGCSSLTSISLPECSHIDEWAFYLCSSLSVITLELNSVCSLVSSDAFENTQITSSTGSILVPASLLESYKTDSVWSYFWNRIFSIPEPYYVLWDDSYYTGTFSMNGNTYNYSDYYPSNYFSSPDFSETITSNAFESGPFSYVETNAYSIESKAFHKCRSLTSAYLSKCEYIGGYYAFAGCWSLSDVSLPVCKSVPYQTFVGCSSLSQISLPECTLVSTEAFLGLENLKKIDLPKCRTIGTMAFQECSSLTQISLPLCEIISNYAFAECTYLSSIDLPRVSIIGQGAFENCINLDTLILRYGSVVSLQVYAFSGTPFNYGRGHIYVPANLLYTYRTTWTSYSSIIFPIPT